MIGLVLVTHGRLADEFRAALEHVMGPQKQIEVITIGAEDDSDLCRSDIIEAVNRVDSGDGVAILSDMFGGTPSSLAISIMDKAKVEVIAGLNLPMLIKLASVRRSNSQPLRELAHVVAEKGQKSIPIIIPRFKNYQPPKLSFSWKGALRREFYDLSGIIPAFFALDIIGNSIVYRRITFDPLWGSLFIVGFVFFLIMRILKKKTHLLKVDGR